MNASRIRQKIRRLKGERERVESQLMGFKGELAEGCLSERYTECRKGNCKCTKGKPHGPFLYMSVKVKGKVKYFYVGKKEDQKKVKGLRRYKEFQSRLAEARKINAAISVLWNTLRKELLKK